MRYTYDWLRDTVRRLLAPHQPRHAAAVLTQHFGFSMIDWFNLNPDNPYLVSFPRTGSGLLRMMIELYYERPTLVQSIFFKDSLDYILMHTYDLGLTVQRRNVIYLYRDPIATVYWQMQSLHENPHDSGRVVHWAKAYAAHLNKWLFQEAFTRQKTVVVFEGLRHDPTTEFRKVAAHFGHSLKRDRIASVAARFAELKKQQQVMQTAKQQPTNGMTFAGFQQLYQTRIWDVLYTQQAGLQALFT